MASIKKTAKGDYRIRVSAGFDGNGKRKYHTETYTPTSKTEKAVVKEVNHYAEVLEERVHAGLIAVSDGTTFMQFIDTWASQWAAEHLTLSQQESYKGHLQAHAVPVIGNMKLVKIKKQHIIQIVQNLKEAGLAPKTIRRIITATRSVFRYALYLEIINSDPCDGIILPPLEKKDEIHCFDTVQAQRFLNALYMKYPKHYKSRKRTDSAGNPYEVAGYTEYKEIPLQLRIFFTLAIQGGFRRGELIALTWDDIDFSNHIITVSKAVSETKEHGQIVGEPKTQSSYRSVYLPSDCFDLLADWYDTQKEYCRLSSWEGMPEKKISENPVFIQSNGKRMDLHTPGNRFTSILKQYNALIEEEAKQLPTAEAQALKRAEKLPIIRLHDLRHTFATLLITQGTDIVTVSKLMGHASPSITMDVYSHLLKQNAKDAAIVFERLFKKPESNNIVLQA